MTQGTQSITTTASMRDHGGMRRDYLNFCYELINYTIRFVYKLDGRKPSLFLTSFSLHVLHACTSRMKTILLALENIAASSKIITNFRTYTFARTFQLISALCKRHPTHPFGTNTYHLRVCRKACEPVLCFSHFQQCLSPKPIPRH